MSGRNLILGLGLLLLTGCYTISLHPLCTEESVVFDPALLGKWAENDDLTWNVARREDGAYRVTRSGRDHPDGPAVTEEFVVHLVEVKGHRFLDFYPEDLDSEQSIFYQSHLVPGHSFQWLRQTVPTLETLELDQEWLEEYLASNPRAVRHEVVDGGVIVLTAPPKKLQRFLLRLARIEEAWGEPSTLTRVPDGGGDEGESPEAGS